VKVFDFLDIQLAFERFVEGTVFPAIDGVGHAIGKAGDAVVEKICDIEEAATQNPLKTAGIIAGAVTVGGLTGAFAPVVLGPIAAASAASGVGAGIAGTAAAVTAGEVADAVILSAAGAVGAMAAEKAVNAIFDRNEKEDEE
jgi:hypothetical protein